MPNRTCAVREVVALVDSASRNRPGTRVAISGFPGSDSDTLAALLRDRLSPGADVVEGPRLFGVGLPDDFDLRIWMDLDLDQATMRVNEREVLASLHDKLPGGPLGHWAAEPAGGTTVALDPVEQQFFEDVRPDRAADLLVVPVGGLRLPIEIRFMPEPGVSSVLWDVDNDYLGELEDLLPMQDDLRRRIKAWASRHVLIDSGAEEYDERSWREFFGRTEQLSDELQRALGSDFTVVHHRG